LNRAAVGEREGNLLPRRVQGGGHLKGRKYLGKKESRLMRNYQDIMFLGGGVRSDPWGGKRETSSIRTLKTIFSDPRKGTILETTKKKTLTLRKRNKGGPPKKLNLIEVNAPN